MKKTSFVEENIIYLLTEMDEKVQKTYENEIWNQHNAKNWIVFAFFGNIQIMQKSIQKSKTPGLDFTSIQQQHRHCNTINA